ncbi:helix-turn-helix domain-containing protein [Microvirga sp. HBU67558]|uniref:Crp/Fnr family transcriptional regulator n=1 Tax=Microvirga TaxID=186650 RepID=UPI001B35E894|nr:MULTISPECIES: Crp/Fnr family transcriptional regulator [unclassified Microvirga]MBQ0822860.1 helix-turn-helix domain-containing protein [Microvirga sp. HBU67558]
MLNPLVRKLENFAWLSDDDRRALETATRQVRAYRPREDVIHEGDQPESVKLLLDGWACRCKQLEDGRRQIMAFFVPGDLCDVRVFILRQMDHSIMTLSPATVATIPRDTMLALMEQHPRITQALWWSTLVDEAVLREWVVNLGQRSADERLAHLLCELFIRLQAVGLTRGNTCELPVTQGELADTLGLTTVHVNRTLQELRRDGLVDLRGKTLTLRDLDGLQRLALFNPNYLHLEHEGEELNANHRRPDAPGGAASPLP